MTPEAPPTASAPVCFCGGSRVASFDPAYDQCCACGTFHVVRRPSRQSLEAFYTLDGYWRDYVSTVQRHPSIDARAQLLERDGRVAHWWGLVTRFIGPPRRIFEIGFAEGSFLKFCQTQGVPEIAGIEVDAGTCAFVRERTGIDRLYSGLFPPDGDVGRDYDAVVGFDVLEHVLDPVGFLDRIADMLADDGIAVLQTPCWRGEGPGWDPMKPDEHVFLLNTGSACTLFDRSRLVPVAIEPGYFRHDMFLMARKR